jgi:hypothetical protein
MKELKNLESCNNNKLLVGLPVNTFEDEFLSESLYSIATQTKDFDLVIVVPESMDENRIKRIEEIADEPYRRVVVQDKDGNPKSEIVKSERKLNYAIEKIPANSFASVFNCVFNLANEKGYQWFSLVEKDDVAESTWIEYFEKYSEELENISVFLPLTRQISAGNMMGHINEAPWLEGRAEVAGQADLTMLMSWNCLNPTGAFYKVESLKEVSEQREDEKYYPFKENMKISSSYEFFLRMVYEDLKTYTIPRYGYQMRMSSHGIDDFSSKIPSNITTLPSEKGGMTQHEIGFWMEQARTEYFMAEDREIEYEAPTVDGAA